MDKKCVNYRIIAISILINSKTWFYLRDYDMKNNEKEIQLPYVVLHSEGQLLRFENMFCMVLWSHIV